MTENFLVTAWIESDNGELIGPLNFDFDCGFNEVKAPMKEAPLKMSHLVDLIEKSGVGSDLGEDGISQGLILQSIVRVGVDDEKLETTTGHLQCLNDSYERAHNSHSEFALEMSTRLSRLIEGIKNGDIKSGATVNQLQRLLAFANQHVVIDEDTEIEA